MRWRLLHVIDRRAARTVKRETTNTQPESVQSETLEGRSACCTIPRRHRLSACERGLLCVLHETSTTKRGLDVSEQAAQLRGRRWRS